MRKFRGSIMKSWIKTQAIALFDTWPWFISQCQFHLREPNQNELYWMQKHQTASHIVVHQTNKWLLKQNDRCTASWKEDGNFFHCESEGPEVFIFTSSNLLNSQNWSQQLRSAFLFSFFFKLHSYQSWYLSRSRNIYIFLLKSNGMFHVRLKKVTKLK